ncbi:MAG: hypothetical protein IK033_03810 [Verrucomicrobia bacterium]|nr:hypothetical protein [Verrucomicrobiota bacterium]
MDELKENQGNNSAGNKPFLAGVILLVVVLCASGAWIKYTQQQNSYSQNQQRQRLQEESDRLHAQLDEANALYLAEANRVNAESHDPLDPDRLAAQLYKMDNSVSEYERNKLAFYCLEGFLINGTNALPAIKNLLISDHNFDLNIKRLYSPRTLRQEVINLLISMKNRPAADLLSQLLPAAQDSKEMRNLCEALLSVSDGYRPYCIQAARAMHDRLVEEQKDTTANATEITSMRSILLQLLQDKEFAVELMEQKAWRKNNGIDSYLFSMSYNLLKEDIIPYCHEAALWQLEKQLENRKGNKYFGRDSILADIATKHITQPQASDILLMALKNDTITLSRYDLIFGLSLEKGFRLKAQGMDWNRAINKDEIDSNVVDLEMIQKANDRLLFLDTVAAQFGNDPQIMQAVEIVRSNLRHTANPDPDKGKWIAEPSFREIRNNIHKQIRDEQKALMEEIIKK